MIDCIFISNGSKNRYRILTQNAVKSCLATEISANPIVCDVEPWKYKGANMVYPKGEFNYNRFLNEGARTGTAEYIGLFNNDVVFKRDWFKHIRDAFVLYNIESASPYCPNTHPTDFGIVKNAGTIVGNEVRKHIAGWAIIMKRSLFDMLGGLDESSVFWCSDNRYQLQLIAAGAKHALVTSSEVVHLGSQTLRDLGGKAKEAYTMGDVKQWNKDTGENKFGWGV